MRIRFANWQPDLQGLTNPGQADTKNVVPSGGGGYSPVYDLSAVSTTGLDDKALGAFSGQDSTDTTQTFAGDASKLYLLSGGAFGDVSKSGGYSASASERWEFVQFGLRVIATQISDPVQYYTMGSSSAFDDLAGSPPQARHIAVVRDFVVLGNTTNSPNEIAWSGFNNSAQWTPGTNQSDTQTLQDFGPVQKIIGGEAGLIFQSRAITRMTYVGPPLIFQFDTIEIDRGLVAPGAICPVGNACFYKALDGFYSFDPVNGSQPIGNAKFDLWFAAHIEPGTEHLISAAIDPQNKLAVFSFVSTDATDSTSPDTLLFYNWTTKEATYAKVAHEFIYRALTEGVTLEQLSAIYSNIETVPDSFDSSQWTGGSSYLAGFTTGHQLAGFSGSTLAATMETSDQEPIPGMRSLVTNIRPLCDTSSAMATVRSRERFADTMADTNTSSMQSNGDIPLLASGRFHRASITIPAGTVWTYATGLDMDAQEDGEM